MLVRAMLPNGFHNLIEGQILLPLLAIASVVTRAGPIQTQEPAQAVGTQLPLQEFQGVPFELLVRQLVDGNHGPYSLIQDSGFRTAIRRLLSFCLLRFRNLSSVGSSTKWSSPYNRICELRQL